MTHQNYQKLDSYMRSCMGDSAHDCEHIYRVLHNALQIAAQEQGVDYDVLITACLLHDIGRKEQFEDPALCHAQVGSEKAESYLRAEGFEEAFCQSVSHCILTHRFRKNNPPQTLEAKILFDADKLDVTGAVGIARTLMYKGDRTEPLYTRREDNTISNGENDTVSSFFREYKFKLEKLYDRFLTPTGARLARHRRQIAVAFYESLYREVSECDEAGREMLARLLEDG